MGFGFGPAAGTPNPYARATVTGYQPTLRDHAARGIAKGFGDGPLANDFADWVMGGTGLGHQHAGLVDWIPGLGQIFQAEEGGRQIGTGHPLAGWGSVALAALPIPAVAKGAKGLIGAGARALEGGAAKGAANVAEKATAPIIAYHGSPYKFDAFDPAFIGDGEGAQAYGHGLYFAENERVAQGYRDKLSPGKLVSPSDIAEYYTPGRIVNGYAGQDKVVRFHPGAADNPGGWSVDVQAVKPDGTPVSGSYVRNHATQPDPAKIEAALGRPLPNGGAMYQVGINSPPEHFLDWDAPLGAQHPVVKKAVEPLLDPMARAYGSGPLATQSMGDVYRRISGQNGAPEIAQKLSDAGVPGIKYLDQNSRVDGDGTRNYVVFNPETIDILKRYGLPAALGVGAGTAAVGAQPGDPQNLVPPNPRSFGFGPAV